MNYRKFYWFSRSILLSLSLLSCNSFALTIQGVKFQDTNNNTIQDINEVGIANEIVYIRHNDLANQGDTDSLFQTTTNTDGSYQITLNGLGSYTIWSHIPDGKAQTVPVSGLGMQPFDFTAASHDTVFINFGLIPLPQFTSEQAQLLVKQGFCRILEREPSANETQIFTDYLSKNHSVKEFIRELALSEEHKQLIYQNQTTETFVTYLYDHILARAPDTQGKVEWVAFIDDFQVSFAEAVNGMFDEFVSREYDVNFGLDKVPGNGREPCGEEEEPVDPEPPEEPELLGLTIEKVGNAPGAVMVRYQGAYLEACRLDCASRNYDVLEGETVVLSFYKPEYVTFEGWGKDCPHEQTAIQVTVEQATHCTATFSLPDEPIDGYFRLNADTFGTGNGIVKMADGSITCGHQCVADYKADRSIYLKAEAQDNFSNFVGWSGDCEGTKTQVKVLMDSSKTCKAEFSSILNNSGNEMIDRFYQQAQLQDGTLVTDYPLVNNQQRLEEAFGFAALPIKYVESNLQITGRFPSQFNGMQWHNTNQNIGQYTKNITFIADATGQYLKLPVKLLDQNAQETWVDILIYYATQPVVNTQPVIYFPYWQ